MSLGNRYNIERIASIIADIEKYIRDLREMDIQSRDDLVEKRNFYAVSMITFTLLNRVFDLGSEMCIAHDIGIPATYREIFTLLRKNRLINEELASDMIGLVTYRNLLSHEYHGLDEEKLFSLTTRIPRVLTFVETMQMIIQSEK